jgi:hypothetical protein
MRVVTSIEAWAGCMCASTAGALAVVVTLVVVHSWPATSRYAPSPARCEPADCVPA